MRYGAAMSNRPFLFLLAAIVVPPLISASARQAQGKTPGPPEVAWKDMTYQQKRVYMKEAVVPAMKPVQASRAM